MEERKSNFDGDNRYYGDFMGKLTILKVLIGTLEIFPFLKDSIKYIRMR